MLIKKYTDKEIVIGVKKRNRKVLNYVYLKFFPIVEAFILSKGGNQAEASDVFQDSIYAVYMNVQNPNFVLTCSFSHYLKIICRNLWVMSLRNRNRQVITLGGNDNSIPDVPESTIKEENEEVAKMDLFIEYLADLPRACREVLELYFAEYTYKEIANELNITYGNARKIKHDCIKRIHKRIINDIRFKKLMDDGSN